MATRPIPGQHVDDGQRPADICRYSAIRLANDTCSTSGFRQAIAGGLPGLSSRGCDLVVLVHGSATPVSRTLIVSFSGQSNLTAADACQ